MRKLKENDHELYREVLVIFVGDFCQMLLVKGSPLFKTNTIQFSSINRDLFLNVPHRFREDKDYGEITRRHRAGKIIKQDTQAINTRFNENQNINVPTITEVGFFSFATRMMREMYKIMM